MTIRVRDDVALRAIGKRVRTARKKKRLSQDDLAIELRQRLPRSNKATGSIISRIEAGSVEAGVDTMAAIAVVLDQPLEKLAPEYVDDARRLRVVIDLVCAPWELNPQPADHRSAAYEWCEQLEIDFTIELPEIDLVELEAAPPPRHLELVA